MARYTYDDFMNEIINILTQYEKTNGAYYQLHDNLLGRREDYNTKNADAVVQMAQNAYDRYLDITNDPEVECFRNAAGLAVDYAAYQIALQYDERGNIDDLRLTQAQIDKLAGAEADWNDLFGNGRGGIGGRTVRQNNRPYQNSYNSAPARPQRASFNRPVQQATTPARSGTAIAAAAIARQQQQQQQNNQPRNSFNDVPRPVREFREHYITDPRLLDFLPRKPGEPSYPEYDPATQAIRAKLSDKNYLEFEILEIKDMDQEAHRTIIQRYTSPLRKNELRTSGTPSVKYAVDGIEISPATAESARMRELIAEAVKQKRIDKEMTFDQLPSDLRRELYIRVSKERHEISLLQQSEAKAKMIANGENQNTINAIMISNVTLPAAMTSIAQAINRFRYEFGTEIDRDTARSTGYRFKVSYKELLYRAESPLKKQMIMNLLTGFKSKHSSIHAIHGSLSDRNLPLSIFTKFDGEATRLVNFILHYLLGISNVTMGGFQNDMDELAQWMVKQAHDNKIPADSIDKLNRIVPKQLATLIEPTNIAHLNHEALGYTDEEAILLLDTGIFTKEELSIIWLPLLSHELGLSGDVAVIDPSVNKTIATLYGYGDMNEVVTHICTADGYLYRYYGLDVNNNLVFSKRGSY